MSMDEMRYAGGPCDPGPPREPPSMGGFFAAVAALVLLGVALLGAMGGP